MTGAEPNATAAALAGGVTLERLSELSGLVMAEMSQDDLVSLLQKQGKGACAIIAIQRHRGSGHAFNAYFDGETVYYVDGQNETFSRWPPPFAQQVSKWYVGIQ